MTSRMLLRSSGEACLLKLCPYPSLLSPPPLSLFRSAPSFPCTIALRRPPLWIAPPPPYLGLFHASIRYPRSFLHLASSRFEPGSSESDEDEDAHFPDRNVEKTKSHGYFVVNFYVLVDIEDPDLEVARHTSFMKDKNIYGRIYLSRQGINAQYSGPWDDVLAYAEWVKQDPRFSNLYMQVSPSHGHTFPRLRLRYKPSLVQVEGGTESLPITVPSSRAIPLTPREWKERLNLVGRSDLIGDPDTTLNENSYSQSQRKMLLLDVRNDYEWDIGHFKGAKRPAVDCFKSTEFGLKESNDNDPLANVDKEHTDVLMYCTGGIRCDVYSTMLRQKGFKNLYSLKGGVARYLAEEEAEVWLGNLFVFDSRLSVLPGAYKTCLDNSKESIKDMNLGRMDKEDQSGFGRCISCDCAVSSIRHRNCANLDCNRLFLSCDECACQLQGCCSVQCTSASRLRPFFRSPQQYKRWHNYRGTGQFTQRPSGL